MISVEDLEVSVFNFSVAPGTTSFSPSDFERYLDAAKQGSADAQYTLGTVFKHGRDVPQDYRHAEEWLLKAADQGHADARYELAHMLETGDSVLPSYLTNIDWRQRFDLYNNTDNHRQEDKISEGAPPEYSESMGQHARATVQEAKGAKGVREAKDASTRFQDRITAAEKGYVGSQYLVGMMYEEGKEVAQDFTEAIKWYLKAARQGYPGAQCRMGDLYEEGKGVPQNHSMAFRWYNKAAFEGDEDAMVTLG